MALDKTQKTIAIAVNQKLAFICVHLARADI